MRVVLVGAGAVGARSARQLVSESGVDALVVVEPDRRRAETVQASLGVTASIADWSADVVDGADVVVLACPEGHRELAEAALERGAHVVSVADDVDEVRSLLDLDAEARERGLSVVVGAGFAPGLSCVLARHAATSFDGVDEVHVAKMGTGGPSCARVHHRALGSWAIDWRDGAWVRRPGGSGRELAWFPDPVCGQDCYRAGLPDALLLVPAPAFAGVRRVTARVAATRRDRLTSRLPMLRKPHPEGAIGAVRVEVRGRRGSGRDVRVLGAIDRPAIAAGAVAAVAADWVVRGVSGGGRGGRPPGGGGSSGAAGAAGGGQGPGGGPSGGPGGGPGGPGSGPSGGPGGPGSGPSGGPGVPGGGSSGVAGTPAGGPSGGLGGPGSGVGSLVRRGAGGLAELVDDPVPFLQELARRGVRAAVFEGVA